MKRRVYSRNIIYVNLALYKNEIYEKILDYPVPELREGRKFKKEIEKMELLL